MDSKLHFVLIVMVLINSYSFLEGKDLSDKARGVEQCRSKSLNESLSSGTYFVGDSFDKDRGVELCRSKCLNESLPCGTYFVGDSFDKDRGVEQCRSKCLNESLPCVTYHYLSFVVDSKAKGSERAEACQHDNASLDVYMYVCPSIVIWTLTGVSLCCNLVLTRYWASKRYLVKSKFKTCYKSSSEDSTLLNDSPLPTISSNDSCNEIAGKEYDKSRLECHNCTKSPESDKNNAALPASTKLSQKRSDDSPKADENEVSIRKKMIEDIQELNERRGCKICLNARMKIVFLPCNHMVACENCSMFLDSCPVCRCRIKGTLQVQNSI